MILHLLCELAAGSVLAAFFVLFVILVFYILLAIGAPWYYMLAHEWPWTAYHSRYNTGLELVVSAAFGALTCTVVCGILRLGAWYCQ